MGKMQSISNHKHQNAEENYYIMQMIYYTPITGFLHFYWHILKENHLQTLTLTSVCQFEEEMVLQLQLKALTCWWCFKQRFSCKILRQNLKGHFLCNRLMYLFLYVIVIKNYKIQKIDFLNRNKAKSDR